MHHLHSHGLLAMRHAVQACQHMHTVQDTVKLKTPISYSTSLRLSIPHSAQQPIANPIKRQSAFASVFIQFQANLGHIRRSKAQIARTSIQ